MGVSLSKLIRDLLCYVIQSFAYIHPIYMHVVTDDVGIIKGV